MNQEANPGYYLPATCHPSLRSGSPPTRKLAWKISGFHAAKFVLLAEDAAHGVTDLAKGRIGLNGVNDQWHKVFATGGTMLQISQGPLYLYIVTLLAQCRQ